VRLTSADFVSPSSILSVNQFICITAHSVPFPVVAKSPASAANVVLRRLPSIAPARTTTTSLSDNKNDDMNTDNTNFFSKFNFFSADGSQTPSTGNDSTYWTRVSPMTGQTRKLQMTTLIKVLIPSIASGERLYLSSELQMKRTHEQHSNQQQ